MQMWTILKTTTMIGSTMIILSMMTTVWNIHMEYKREKGEIVDFRDECQGTSETRNVSHPSARGTPTDLQNRRSRGRVPAECLEQKMRRKLSSHFAQALLYITNG